MFRQAGRKSLRMAEKVLVASTSGVRGIIGRGLDPELAIRYAAAFGSLLKGGLVVVGRDSRPSGQLLIPAVIAGLGSVGCRVIDIGIVPTPTVEIAVKELEARGGICVTASHNPGEWNALKFFNAHGEFITPAEYARLDSVFRGQTYRYATHEKLGSVEYQDGWIGRHIQRTLKVAEVRRDAVARRKFHVVVDAINGAGSQALPELLEKLGCRVTRINCAGDGNFVHEPEPVPKNLAQLSKAVKGAKADLGMACDPDADRLALVDHTGLPIGEELTLAIAILPVIRRKKGPVVINLSTSRVTADVARLAGCPTFYAKVGESNVVQELRKRKGRIGGEGNGGVIYPGFHAGRDSLIAAALVLTALAESRQSLSELVQTLPMYYTTKTKAALPADFDLRLAAFRKAAPELLGKVKVDTRDGVRFDFADGWVQLRRSNTEPIYRLIVETTSQTRTDRLVQQVKMIFK